MVQPKFVDLMSKYPSPANRLKERERPTNESKLVARRFDKEFFDGQRKHGYGGFQYHPRFWSETVQLFIEHYGLGPKDSILDVGCAKGFMLVDFVTAIPDLQVSGIDISDYAISHSHPAIRDRVKVGNCLQLPYPNASFDLVISINTIHNLNRSGCIKAIKEIERVKRRNSYIVVDGWNSDQEKHDLDSWVLTAETVLSHAQWQELFAEAGYSGEYSFWKVR